MFIEDNQDFVGISKWPNNRKEMLDLKKRVDNYIRLLGYKMSHLEFIKKYLVKDIKSVVKCVEEHRIIVKDKLYDPMIELRARGLIDKNNSWTLNKKARVNIQIILKESLDAKYLKNIENVIG